MKKAVAFANNDVSLVAWSYDQKIRNCLGFAVYRVDAKTKQKTALPAWVGFKNQTNTEWKAKDTSIWPLQKFNWNDVTAKRGGSYSYEIIPMVGDPDHLEADTNNRLTTGTVELTPGEGNFRAYFNRGILSTQSLAHQLPQSAGGNPDYKVLISKIEKPGDPLRNALAGQIIEALSSLLTRAKDEGGECYCALYELKDKELIKILVESENIHIILSNTGEDDAENDPARKTLHDAGIDIMDRMLKSGHIGHNKFVVYVDKKGKPQAVLSGSTNWTSTGICAQSNNAIIIESPEIAAIYLEYWKSLKSEESNQSAAFRTRNNKGNASVTVDGSQVDVWFSPNTRQQSKPAKKATEPADFTKVEEAIRSAKETVLFLLFQPGTPSVLDIIVDCQNTNEDLFVRGAATDTKAVGDYTVHLFHRSADKSDDVVAASAIKDQFGYWQKELLKSSPGAHAIIHDKIVVIDPLSPRCAVITGSHNLGYRASYNNDDNLMIIRGNQRLAQMYAVHVMDTYGHYRWRYQLEQNKGKKNVFYGLETDDSWQDKYFSSKNPASNDLRVWFP
jgi:phosphatidylserine/phosphatidylglycerophosphate/cardiolipin synthase-like enzyme